MDDESTGPRVPEERGTTTSGLDRIQAKFADSVDDLSDRELITAILGVATILLVIAAW